MKCADRIELSLWMDRFATLQKDLFEHHVDCLMNYKDFLKLFSKGSSDLIAQIDCLEDGDCLLHGDFHPANIMVDSNNQPVLIDMMNVCRGPTIYDVSRTYFLLEGNKTLQANYLELMGYQEKDIIPYLRVISQIRETEENT